MQRRPPLKLTILALGSRGDVQPIVALGRGLADAGYTVRMVTMRNFEAIVRQQGLDFLPVDGDAQALTNAMINDGGRTRGLNLFQMARGIMTTFGALVESYHQAFTDEALRDSDAILCQLPGGFYGYDLAEALGVPYFALSVIPQEITSAYPIALFPNQRSFGPAYNRLTYRLAQQIAWQPFRRANTRFRRHFGLPSASFWWGNMRRMSRERVPVLQGFSDHVIPREPDWGDHVYTTGYWPLNETGWQPSVALTAFLDQGEPPVFIGFGSMPVPDPKLTSRLILDALRETGKRGILHAGWAKLEADDLPETVFSLDYAPYAWLFPRMAAVIHHGGSGTTGFALRSSVPSMVVPFTADQPFWGKRTHDLGVGPEPIPFPKLTTERLADAIRTMTGSDSMRQVAIRLRDAMADEDGIARAVEIIQRYLSS